MLWYHNTAAAITSWEQLEDELRHFYLSPSELRTLDRQIGDRRQERNEPIRSYITNLSTLIRRRGGFNVEHMLDVLYYNMRFDLRLHVKRRDVQTVSDLIQSVEEVDEVLKLAM